MVQARAVQRGFLPAPAVRQGSVIDQRAVGEVSEAGSVLGGVVREPAGRTHPHPLILKHRFAGCRVRRVHVTQLHRPRLTIPVLTFASAAAELVVGHPHGVWRWRRRHGTRGEGRARLGHLIRRQQSKQLAAILQHTGRPGTEGTAIAGALHFHTQWRIHRAGAQEIAVQGMGCAGRLHRVACRQQPLCQQLTAIQAAPPLWRGRCEEDVVAEWFKFQQGGEGWRRPSFRAFRCQDVGSRREWRGTYRFALGLASPATWFALRSWRATTISAWRRRLMR